MAGQYPWCLIEAHERGAESAVLDIAFLSARWMNDQLELCGLAIRSFTHPA
jgi:hypothetical protein